MDGDEAIVSADLFYVPRRGYLDLCIPSLHLYQISGIILLMLDHLIGEVFQLRGSVA